MNTSKIACRGERRFQWELARWFGGAIGETSWLAFGAIALVWRGEPYLASVSAASWLFVLSLCCWLWARRDRIAPFRALAILLVALSLVMPLVWFACWDVPTDNILPSLHWIRGIRAASACLLAPVALLCFTVREYSTPQS